MTITGQGKNTPWGVSGFGLGPIPRFTDPSGHLRAVSRALAQFIELSRVMDKQLSSWKPISAGLDKGLRL